MSTQPNTKENVNRFDADVKATGSYAYTAEKLSSQLANGRITAGISAVYPFQGKRVLDLGCGDGAYTVMFADLGVESVLGIDPAATAIEAATRRAAAAGVADRVRFGMGNIYELGDLLDENRFDVIVLRGVLHHLPDPARAVAALARFKGAVVVLEPNGFNPVLKLLEKFSKYHIEHEERSFLPMTIEAWLRSAGFEVQHSSVINLVPMFCPDWMARPLNGIGNVVEKLPLVRTVACGQSLIVAQR
ncbi:MULTISPECIES: class I SAM-dependent methyltransferase [Hydrogenophaga]|uniref:Methyltransferase n=1 Tax=Hydrogenophaga intermedia TaxID=65786 RepID=A0A1L1PIW4_HYDIT|nr:MULTISPECIES: class I SAM-dependent methyltransferase [Hydrogenophaga]AOS81326.1 methyltransferase type 11 [Hydrogenophaga sp. PBC]TMU74214.1 class I SAM-dependent methyltransferase [Hydrogenophaga intermedia]CDN87699.1 Methyltransferase [Hydrogenophaga intermedia]